VAWQLYLLAGILKAHGAFPAMCRHDLVAAATPQQHLVNTTTHSCRQSVVSGMSSIFTCGGDKGACCMVELRNID
jgi:hypothetical protein